MTEIDRNFTIPLDLLSIGEHAFDILIMAVKMATFCQFWMNFQNRPKFLFLYHLHKSVLPLVMHIGCDKMV